MAAIILPVKEINAKAAQALEKLAELFPRGYVFTFLARHRTEPEANVVVTNDSDLSAASKALRKEMVERNDGFVVNDAPNPQN